MIHQGRDRAHSRLGHHFTADDRLLRDPDLVHLVEPAADHPDVVFHHPVTETAELLLDLRPDSLEQPLLVQSLPLHHGRRPEERSEECRSLHPVAQLRV